MELLTIGLAVPNRPHKCRTCFYGGMLNLEQKAVFVMPPCDRFAMAHEALCWGFRHVMRAGLCGPPRERQYGDDGNPNNNGPST
jgi:hypothetical protein